jgi:hypothetical protein
VGALGSDSRGAITDGGRAKRAARVCRGGALRMRAWPECYPGLHSWCRRRSLPGSAGGRHPSFSSSKVDGLAFVLAHPAPDPVRLADGESVFAAFADHRALRTDGAGGGITVASGGAALALGVEEERGIGVTTGTLQLPLPQIGNRSGEPGDLRHVPRPSWWARFRGRCRDAVRLRTPIRAPGAFGCCYRPLGRAAVGLPLRNRH